ncbi:glycosyl transferases group 1 [Lucifera butyrica]|uniref:Glycogen synthase n=1 Tax=Lucifera butyrica TaxID=1351585 RepID=A0A498R124_9FIRM|nr:glycogen synthase GlgA [Lucifera butyrica]VBB05021.1 glycosyl transferases group 1 [Lucifera butyrica]
MKILFVAAEAVPFIKTGGLGDVAGSLPKELKRQGVDVRVILPKYADIPARFREQMIFIRDFDVYVGWRKQFCAVQELVHDGVTFYFVDNEYYFKRPGIYGFYDEAERYAYFTRAVLEALPKLDFRPDIIHAHDWHAGMVSVFLNTHYQHIPFYQNIKTVFTIHNLAYQGIFPAVVLEDILGLGMDYFTNDKLEFNGNVNFMKGGIIYSDIVTTVSKTYAEEIQRPYFGENLDGLLRARNNSLYGIVNGIDYNEYDPATDPLIASPYSWRATRKRQENKLKLQEFLGLPVRRDVPMLAMVSRLVSAKGLDLIERVLEEILSMDLQLVVLGTGEERYHHLFSWAQSKYPDKVSANLKFDNTLAHQIYAASDLFLMPSKFEPCGIGQIIAMRYGSLPVVRETGGLKDTVQPYNEITGEGTGFRFANYNAHELLYTVQRAVGLYADKKLWHNIMKNAMLSDYSWRQSVMQYRDLYEQLTVKKDLLLTEQDSAEILAKEVE